MLKINIYIINNNYIYIYSNTNLEIIRDQITLLKIETKKY